MTCQIMKGSSEELPVLVILLGPDEDAGTLLEALGKDVGRATFVVIRPSDWNTDFLHGMHCLSEKAEKPSPAGRMRFWKS